MRRAFSVSALGLALAAPAASQSLVVRAEMLHTSVGVPIEGGVVVIRDGRIAAVGPATDVSIPGDLEVLEAAVVTPGLIDAHTVIGLSGYLNQPHDQDQLERSSPVQPELRAIDAYDAREPLVQWVRGLGVTTIHTGHGPGALISGQTLIAKTRGNSVAEAVIVPVAMVAATLGESALVPGAKPPGTRGKLAAMLRAELVAAGEYAAKNEQEDASKRPPRNLKLEVLARVLSGELPLLISAQRHQDISTALRLQAEFGFRLVLDGAAEAPLLLESLRDAGVPVIVHATMARAVGETQNLSMETASLLADAGIPVALQSGFEAYVPKTRVLLFEAGLAAARGLGAERALAAITIDAARLLGIDDRVGSLEVGKDGDVALYDGDPFEYTTHCLGAVIEGEFFSGVR